MKNRKKLMNMLNYEYRAGRLTGALCICAMANDLYVAPDGKPEGDGSNEKPLDLMTAKSKDGDHSSVSIMDSLNAKTLELRSPPMDGFQMSRR